MTNHGLKVFKNEQFGQVRTLDEDGTILFCGKDVALALGYSKTEKAITDNCRSPLKRRVPHPQNPEKQITMTFIPEGDLYRLIIRSRLPEAERFERWVFEEVLPVIRQYGAYYAPESRETRSDEQMVNIMSQVLEKLLPTLLRWNTDPKYQRKQPYSSLVYALSPEILQEVEDMLLVNHVSYVEISTYLKKRYDIDISKSAIGRYAIYLRGKVRDKQIHSA